MKISLDARNKPCPQPVVMTKNAYNELPDKGELTVVVDSDLVKNNILEYLTSKNILFSVLKKGEEFHISMVKNESAAQIVTKSSELPISSQNKKNRIIVIKSDKMGDGPEELGLILIRAFINTIQEMAPLPDSLILYSGGVSFVLKDSTVLDSIKTLEQRGVKIIVCGTCVNYFNKKDQVAIGKISNMYEIMELFMQADTIICP